MHFQYTPCYWYSLFSRNCLYSYFLYSVGIVFYYGIFQVTVWWFCHVVSLFWGIRFPFHFKSFKATHRLKYVHITMVIVGLVLPTLPVILPFTTGDPNMRGFGLTVFPPTNCDSLQVALTFFSLPLPINLLLVTGIPLLIIVLWIIHKVTSHTVSVLAVNCRCKDSQILKTYVTKINSDVTCSCH